MKTLTRNALLASLYAVVALTLPATALANYRLTTALYVLASLDPGLVPGLALGNALAGMPQGPVDVVLGGVVGLMTAWVCAKLGKWSPIGVLIVPTLVVPLWLSLLYKVPYAAIVPVLLQGQVLSAILGFGLLRVKPLTRLFRKEG